MKKIAALAMCLTIIGASFGAFLLPKPVSAAGMTLSNLSIPASVDINKNFNIKFRLKNTSGRSLTYALLYCTITTSYTSGGSIWLDWSTFSTTSSDGSLNFSSVSSSQLVFVDPTQAPGKMGFNAPSADLTRNFDNGVTYDITLVTKVMPNASGSARAPKNGDKFSTTISCKIQNDTDSISVGATDASTTIGPIVVAPPPAPAEPKAKIASVAYPTVFKATGSTTTDLSGVTVSGAKSVTNYTLEIVGAGKVVFSEGVDLSSDQFATDLAKLDQFVTIAAGKVSINSEELAMLNKKATITLTGLKLTKDGFVIMHNGVVDDAATASAQFDTATGILTFTVTGFSEYTVAPIVSINSNADPKSEEKYVLTGSVGDLGSSVVVKNNDQVVASGVKLDDSGNFATDITLAGGVNNIVVEATGVSGSKGSQALNVTYNKPLLKTLQDNVGLVIAAIVAVVLIIAGAVFFVLHKKGRLPFGKKTTIAAA